MGRTDPTSTSPATAPVTPFRSILCGVDGSRIAAEAARQAAILATAGARVRLLGVGWEEGHGRWASATIEPHRLAAALETARLEARGLGVAPEVRLVESRDETSVLLTHASESDLLVLGASSPSRGIGILAGSTATAAVHSAPVPVLLARRPPDGVAFPSSILAAIDGSPATPGVAAAAALFASAHDARVSVIAPSNLRSPAHGRVLAAIASIHETTGAEPLVLDEHAAAHKAIVAAAASVDAALVVIGSRGLEGVHALTSVSERVAHEAPCSVLVLRPRGRAQNGTRP
jgi:nucleotide-binding universal stress UspA family protein